MIVLDSAAWALFALSRRGRVARVGESPQDPHDEDDEHAGGAGRGIEPMIKATVSTTTLWTPVLTPGGPADPQPRLSRRRCHLDVVA
jgi:hypothetical protein